MNNQTHLKFLVVFILIPYFLFNIGFINEIAKDHVDVAGVVQSIPLNWLNNDTLYFNEKEVFGVEWLDNVSGDERIIVTGDSFSNSLLSFWFPRQVFMISFKRDIPEAAYVYFRTWNIEKQEVIVYDPIRETSEHIHLDAILELRYAINIRNKIYDNSGAQVFASR